ncbi:hypothetical protein LSH36_231g03021 [Paralvinella palmiformis]|uniref:Uncharacterized protein n=1 Tax=Paralvinella palmiformis TaxID=53620 RepID=A0AAD9JM77_9ANNE|nr:hypothetical protein LSH36_231g03021 [Paralvinella palmiformis]
MFSSAGDPDDDEKETIRRLLNPDENRQRRTIRAAEYIAVRESLPHSALSRVILNINVCIQRQLDIEKEQIQKRERRYSACFEHSRRAFLEGQAKKNQLWKSRDVLKMNSMNLPILTDQSERLPGMKVVYTNPRYLPQDEDGNDGGDEDDAAAQAMLMPYERLRRSRTEILRHKHDFYTSKLPTVTEVDERELRRFKTFCAGDFIRDSLNDSRFRLLDGALERNKSGSPSRFVRWLAKRFPEGSSKDNTNYQYKYQHRRRPGVIFPSLIKNRQPPANDEPAPLTSAGNKRPTRNAAASDGNKPPTRGTEGIRHVLGLSDAKTATSRQFNSPSHKHRFEVKSDIIRSQF